MSKFGDAMSGSGMGPWLKLGVPSSPVLACVSGSSPESPIGSSMAGK
jgi:hypothetical protein